MLFRRLRGISLLLFFVLLHAATFGQAIPEWQDPQVVSVNTEKPRADFIPYPSEKSALAREPKSPFVQSLNGNWKFKWASNPSRATVQNRGPVSCWTYLYNQPVNPANEILSGRFEG